MFPLPQTIELQRAPIRYRSSGFAAGDHASPLHPEHDGEQLHLPADADRLLLSIRVVAQRQSARAAVRLGGVRSQPPHTASNRARSFVGNVLPTACPVVGGCPRPGPLGLLSSLHRDCSPGIPVLWFAGPPLSVPSLRNVPPHLHHLHWPRNQDDESFAASQLSFRDPLARGVFRGPL